MTTTVTGNLKNLGTGTITAGGFVRFWLRGCGGNQPRVNGTAIIGPSQNGVFYFDINGDGSKTSEWYGMQVYLNGKAGPEVPVQAKNGATLDITNVTPITATPAATAPSGDSTYARLDGGNQPFTGGIQAPKFDNLVFMDGSVNLQTAAGLQSAHDGLPSTGGVIVIPSPGFTLNATVNITKPVYIIGFGPGKTAVTLTYSPATGNMFNVGNQSGRTPFAMAGLHLKTTTSTTSVALQLAFVEPAYIGPNIELDGFAHQITVTGNGTSDRSVSVYIHDLRMVNSPNVSGATGISLDHVADVYMTNIDHYPVVDCLFPVGLLIDQGADGIYAANCNFNSGLNTLLVRATNQGGSYGAPPAAMWFSNCIFNGSTGGDCILFDTTLTTSLVRATFTGCEVAGAGLKSDGTYPTAGAIGINVEGGSEIEFNGGLIRVCALNGVYIAGSVANDLIQFQGTRIYANNQSNNAGGHGIQIGSPTTTHIMISNCRIGNIIDSGGQQRYGIAIVNGASNTHTIMANDCANNVTGTILYGTTGHAIEYTGGKLGLDKVPSANLDITGTIAATGQISSTVATGTAPFAVSSTDPVANLTATPTTYNKSGTQQTTCHIVKDSSTLSGGTVTVTLTGSAVFTSSSSYVVICEDSTGINGTDVTYTSGSQFVINGTATDVIRWIAIGN